MTERATKVLVVGSANVDMIVQSERLPRPGETVVGGEFSTAGGGKGANQAIAARRLGADVAFVARVGQDGPGQFTLDALRAEGLDLAWMTVDPDAATGVALILVDRDGQNMISVASGANSHLSVEDVQRASPVFATARVLVTQLEIPLDTTRAALTLARAHGLITILNPAPARPVPDDIFALADWLTPNELEATALAGLVVHDPPTALEAGQNLLRRGARNVVVTLGAQGAVLVTPAETAVLPPFHVLAVDTTAAGDAFTAGLAVGLGLGKSTRHCLVFAAATGALAATKAGAQPSLPRHADVLALISAGSNRPPGAR
jgi:ribokinase